MRYEKIHTAVFVNRPNRFVANVILDGKEIAVHVKNTGRCKELLFEGVKVILSESDNETRKYRYDLVSVYKESVGWVNIDSQAPNVVVKEWLNSENGLFSNLSLIAPEKTYGDSRFDFYLEENDGKTTRKIYMEVKGCTQEYDLQGFFPDAPTLRGVKHIHELIKAKHEGYDAYLAFVIQMEKVQTVLPNATIHKDFETAFYKAIEAGVKIVFLHCKVTEDELNITDYQLR